MVDLSHCFYKIICCSTAAYYDIDLLMLHGFVYMSQRLWLLGALSVYIYAKVCVCVYVQKGVTQRRAIKKKYRKGCFSYTPCFLRLALRHYLLHSMHQPFEQLVLLWYISMRGIVSLHAASHNLYNSYVYTYLRWCSTLYAYPAYVIVLCCIMRFRILFILYACSMYAFLYSGFTTAVFRIFFVFFCYCYRYYSPNIA